MVKFNDIHFILTDIEGTTTSVSFVFDVLFPYFKTYFQEFVKENYQKLSLEKYFSMVKETILEEEEKQINEKEVIDTLLHWAEIDRKHTALKALQGLVWQVGYQKGDLQGHIYQDVPEQLQNWYQKNIQLGIYSSGSVTAQKLLFGSSVFGDLTHYFSFYFDTNIGHKRETESYHNIQKEIGIQASNILFLSDIEQELDAAQSAGFKTLQLVRDTTIPSQKHSNVQNFKEILIENKI
jgi:enolase-phosphatase E1